MRPDRVPNESLLECGLDLMRQNDHELTRRAGTGRSMIFDMDNGESVRARTANDHILITVASGPGEDATLNISGTDWLLIVMPEEERIYGPVLAYLVPVEVAEAVVRDCHLSWLKSTPNTKGNNTTWNIWFKKHAKSGGFAEHWRKYRLSGESRTEYVPDGENDERSDRGPKTLGQAITEARHSIAQIAGVEPTAVKISVDLG